MICDAIMQTHTNFSLSDGCHQSVSLLQYGLTVTRHINIGSIAPHSHWQLRCVTNELQSVCPSDIAVSYYRITFSNLHVCLNMEFMVIGTEENGPENILLQEFETTWTVKCGKLQESKRDLNKTTQRPAFSHLLSEALHILWTYLYAISKNRARWGSNGTAFDLKSGGPRHGIPTNLRFLVIFWLAPQ